MITSYDISIETFILTSQLSSDIRILKEAWILEKKLVNSPKLEKYPKETCQDFSELWATLNVAM